MKTSKQSPAKGRMLCALASGLVWLSATGTAQTRVELWREWLTTFRENMLTGKGMSLPKEEDMLVKRYDDLAARISDAARIYAEEVRARAFPTADQTYRPK